MIVVLAARRWPHILRRFPKLDPLPVCSEDSASATERGLQLSAALAPRLFPALCALIVHFCASSVAQHVRTQNTHLWLLNENHNYPPSSSILREMSGDKPSAFSSYHSEQTIKIKNKSPSFLKCAEQPVLLLLLLFCFGVFIYKKKIISELFCFGQLLCSVACERRFPHKVKLFRRPNASLNGTFIIRLPIQHIVLIAIQGHTRLCLDRSLSVATCAALRVAHRQGAGGRTELGERRCRGALGSYLISRTFSFFFTYTRTKKSYPK